MRMVSGTGIIGQDWICGFWEKNKIVWELGNIDADTGEDIEDNTRVRTKNFFKCKSNKKYRLTVSPKDWYAIFEYDKGKNFILKKAILSSNTHITSDNCAYMRFVYTKTKFDVFEIKERLDTLESAVMELGELVSNIEGGSNDGEAIS